mgnify:CR=1 FL=1
MGRRWADALPVDLQKRQQKRVRKWRGTAAYRDLCWCDRLESHISTLSCTALSKQVGADPTRFTSTDPPLRQAESQPCLPKQITSTATQRTADFIVDM